MTTTSDWNATCLGPDANPDPLRYPIPKNINFAFLPAGDGNASSPWMTRCCSPYISLVDNCYLWCELPGVKNPVQGMSEQEQIMAAFRDCTRRNNKTDQSRIISYHFGGDAARVGGMKGVLLWVVLASSLVVFL
ncbi:hypothetical protein B0T18DRAFT_395316 [Schizothecium vesticola]|uniref:Uncharacterized protein n=1 Tax=Schizothecium vesticola TaxID=314040 RepID=A0AA40F8M8_9PEZI|nr:hypothetical protein B0T18DRAFT_395316 [Schizothecium vesticola]